MPAQTRRTTKLISAHREVLTLSRGQGIQKAKQGAGSIAMTLFNLFLPEALGAVGSFALSCLNGVDAKEAVKQTGITRYIQPSIPVAKESILGVIRSSILGATGMLLRGVGYIGYAAIILRTLEKVRIVLQEGVNAAASSQQLATLAQFEQRLKEGLNANQKAYELGQADAQATQGSSMVFSQVRRALKGQSEKELLKILAPTAYQSGLHKKKASKPRQ